MYEWLENLRILVSLAFLSYASWLDYRTREVSNRVWLLYAPLGLTLTLLQIFVTNHLYLLPVLVISFLVLSGITIPLFYLGFFGGADVKAYISLSLALPFEPSSSLPRLGVVSPLYSMSIFGNAVTVSALTAVALLLYNIVWHVRTGEKLFEGLDHESSIKKLIAMFTGYKIDSSKFTSKLHLAPMEEPSKGENGTIKRSLKLFIRTDEDRDSLVAKIEAFPGELKKVWVTPYLPFIVFITLGFLLTLFVGDLIFWLITIIL